MKYQISLVVQWLRNLPIKAGYVSFIPDWGRVPKSCMRQLSPYVATTEPTCSNCWSFHALEPELHKKPLQ